MLTTPKEPRLANGQPCPECGEPVVRNAHESVCSDCNVVTDDTPIDYGPEWRAFDRQETWERSRTGPIVAGERHDSGLTTRISTTNTDGNGLPLSDTERRRAARLRRLNRWFVECTESERSLRDGLIQVRKLATDLDLTQSVIARAQTLFRMAVNEGVLYHYGIDRTAAAVVYVTCRLEELSVHVDEVTVVAQADRRGILRAYRFLCRELDLEVPPLEAGDAVPAICTELDVGREVERRAKATLDAYRKDNIGAGTFPSTLAATAVYAVCRNDDAFPDITQTEVGDAAGVNNCTISTRYAEMREYVE